MFTTKKSLRIVMWRQLCYILGKLHFRSAETLLFIEGRSTLSTQLRLSMFRESGGGAQFWGEIENYFWLRIV